MDPGGGHSRSWKETWRDDNLVLVQVAFYVRIFGCIVRNSPEGGVASACGVTVLTYIVGYK